MEAAARSFTDPPGFFDSSLAWISTPACGSSRRRRTSGVLPMSDQTAARGVSRMASDCRMTAGSSVGYYFVDRQCQLLDLLDLSDGDGRIDWPVLPQQAPGDVATRQDRRSIASA